MTTDPLQILRDAIDGLDYPSESDSPFTLIDQPLPDVGLGAATEISPDEFFGPLQSVTDSARFAQLRQALEELVHPLRVFRVDDGSAEVKIFLIGRTASGRFAGVSTTSVET